MKSCFYCMMFKMSNQIKSALIILLGVETNSDITSTVSKFHLVVPRCFSSKHLNLATFSPQLISQM